MMRSKNKKNKKKDLLPHDAIENGGGDAAILVRQRPVLGDGVEVELREVDARYQA